MTLRLVTAFAELLILVLVSGCATSSKFTMETVRLKEPAILPFRMASRSDLIEVSDCRFVFDLSCIPEVSGISLVEYNPFDPNTNGRAKTALCPIRKAIWRVLQDGISRVFVGDETIPEIPVRLVPVQLDLSREGSSVRCILSFSAQMLGEPVMDIHSERTIPWTDEYSVPDAVYAAAATLGDQLLDAIANSRRIRDKMLENQSSGGGIPPTVTSWNFGKIANDGFSGVVDIHAGSWDMARVQRWTRAQIEQAALARLGVKSLDNYRVLVDGGSSLASEGRLSFNFRVFPYSGFELSYDSTTRIGTCTANVASLGLSEKETYRRAVRFVELILSDQGVVKTTGKDTAPAQYRFNGYHSLENGTKIEIPFELIN